MISAPVNAEWTLSHYAQAYLILADAIINNDNDGESTGLETLNRIESYTARQLDNNPLLAPYGKLLTAWLAED